MQCINCVCVCSALLLRSYFNCVCAHSERDQRESRPGCESIPYLSSLSRVIPLCWVISVKWREPKATNIHLLTKPKSKQQYCSCSFFSKHTHTRRESASGTRKKVIVFFFPLFENHENMNNRRKSSHLLHMFILRLVLLHSLSPTLALAFFLFSVDWLRNGSSENKQNALRKSKFK